MNTKIMAGVLVGAMTLAASLGTAAEARHHHHHNNWNQAYNGQYGYGNGNAYQNPYANQNYIQQAQYNQAAQQAAVNQLNHSRGAAYGGGWHGHH